MEYYYLLILLFLIIIIFRFYVKVTYKFWAYQPVFHYYNLLYWVFPIGIINKNLPESNKYCNFINITCKNFFDYGEKDIDNFVNLIKKNYNRNKDANYLPDKNMFTQYFTGHLHKSYIAVYNKPEYKMENNNISTHNKYIGIITGKPINITINKKIKYNGYYVDFLCVDKDNRSKNIAPELIQTYEYTQRHDNKKSVISLFKREGVLTGIVPLTVFKSYMFYINTITDKSSDKSSDKDIIKINNESFNLFKEYISSSNFSTIVTVSESNLLNLINNNIYHVYAILKNNTIKGCYIFKENYMVYNDEQLYKKEKIKYNSIDMVSSICNVNKEEFIKGFIICLNNYKNKIKYINIENISNNNIIIEHLNNKLYKPKFVAPMAYFYYNYASRPSNSQDVLIIV